MQIYVFTYLQMDLLSCIEYFIDNNYAIRNVKAAEVKHNIKVDMQLAMYESSDVDNYINIYTLIVRPTKLYDIYQEFWS